MTAFGIHQSGVSDLSRRARAHCTVDRVDFARYACHSLSKVVRDRQDAVEPAFFGVGKTSIKSIVNVWKGIGDYSNGSSEPYG